MNNFKFLITGGCGFIGTALIRRLVELNPGAHIRVLDNLVTGALIDLRGVTDFVVGDASTSSDTTGVFFFQGDVRDSAFVNICTSGVDCVVHLAANTGVGPSVEDPRLDMDCNVVGSFNVLEAARINGAMKFVFASSGAPIGEVEPPIHEEIAPHPVSPYGASKLAGEGYCSAYYRTFGLETVCLRFGNVYGPGSYNKASLVAKFVKLAMNDEVCEIYGDGSQTRDFIYIDDLVSAILLAIEKPVGGEIFQIATGRERTVMEVAILIQDSLKSRGLHMSIEHQPSRLGDVLRNYSDTSKALRLLGWQSKTELEVGIGRTLDWFLRET